MKRLWNRIRGAFAIHNVSKSLPDHYAGELNTKRIKAYRLLHWQYNLEEGTVQPIHDQKEYRYDKKRIQRTHGKGIRLCL
jgi:hypothetical protein